MRYTGVVRFVLTNSPLWIDSMSVVYPWSFRLQKKCLDSVEEQVVGAREARDEDCSCSNTIDSWIERHSCTLDGTQLAKGSVAWTNRRTIVVGNWKVGQSSFRNASWPVVVD